MKDLEKIFDENFSTVDNMEGVLSILKSEGMSLIDTVKLIRNKTGLSLKASDELVLNSNTWKSEKDRIIDFRNDFMTQFFDLE